MADNAELALNELLESKTDEFLAEGDKIIKGEAPVVEAAPSPAPPAVETPPTPAAPLAAEPTTEPAPVPQTAAERKAYTDFLAKHGGDPEKGSQHYFEVMRQNAEFKRKLDEAEVAAKQPTKAEPVSPPPPEVPALVAKLDQQILTLASEFATVDDTLKKIVSVKPQWLEHRDNLIDQLTEAVDADQAAKIRADLAVARRNITKLDNMERDYTAQYNRIRRDYEYADTNKQLAQQLHEESRARTSLESTSEGREVQEERSRFLSAVDRAITAKGIPEADREDFREEIRLRADHKVNRLDESIDDYDAFASEHAERWLARQRRVAAAYGAQKTTDAKPAAPAGKAAVVPAPAKRPTASTLEELNQSLDAQWANERV